MYQWCWQWRAENTTILVQLASVTSLIATLLSRTDLPGIATNHTELVIRCVIHRSLCPCFSTPLSMEISLAAKLSYVLQFSSILEYRSKQLFSQSIDMINLRNSNRSFFGLENFSRPISSSRGGQINGPGRLLNQLLMTRTDVREPVLSRIVRAESKAEGAREERREESGPLRYPVAWFVRPATSNLWARRYRIVEALEAHSSCIRRGTNQE